MPARSRLNISLCCGHTSRYTETFKASCFNIQKLVFARGLYLFISCDFEKIVMMKVKCHSRTGHEGSEVSRNVAVLIL